MLSSSHREAEGQVDDSFDDDDTDTCTGSPLIDEVRCLTLLFTIFFRFYSETK